MDTDINEQDEQKVKKERYELAGHINESTAFIYSLVKRLAETEDSSGRIEIISSMLRDEYRTARSMVDYYKTIGGESYSIDRGMWRDVVGY